MSRKHRTKAEMQPLYEAALEILENEPTLSHSYVAKEVGLSQGQLSRYVRIHGSEKLKEFATSRRMGANLPAKKSGKKKATKKATKKAAVNKTSTPSDKFPKLPTFRELPMVGGKGKTVIIITEDQDIVSTIIGKVLA